MWRVVTALIASAYESVYSMGNTVNMFRMSSMVLIEGLGNATGINIETVTAGSTS